MSKLDIAMRPYTEFDINNAAHRKYFADFHKTKSWGKCPVRFHLNENHSNIVAQINEQAVAYYLTKEFGKAKVVRKLALA